jgi:hypothetical protein
VACYDAGGELRWLTPLVGDDVQLRGLASASDGSSVVTGSFAGAARLGGTELRSAGGSDILAVRLDSRGDVVWAQRAGGTSDLDVGNAVAMLADGSSVVTGQFVGEASFAPGRTLGSAGAEDGFLATYDTRGAVRALYAVAGEGGDYGRDVAASSDGVIYAIGASSAAEEAGARLRTPARFDMFVARFADDTLTWRNRPLIGEAEDRGLAIALAGERIAIGGEFAGTLVFGSQQLYAPVGRALFVATLDLGGATRWAERVGPVERETDLAVAFSADASLVIVGTVKSGATFGQTPLEAGYFLAKLAP